MQYTISRGEKGKVEIKVDVPKKDFEETYKSTLTKLGEGAKIAGFRPGKIPHDVIENNVGLARALNETASSLVSKHLSDIFQKEELTPIDSPKVAFDSLAKESPFSFTVTLTQKPVVKVGDWRKIKVKKLEAKKITDKEVNESITNIFEAWKKQKKSGQKLEASNQEPETKKFIYDAQGNKIFLKDDEKPSSAKASEGQVDDEFARAIGAKDLAHLKELVTKDLEAIIADQVEAKFEEEIFVELRKISEVEIPDILVEDELNRILLRLSSQLEKEGKELKTYLEEQKTTLEELKNKWREKATENVKTSLTIDAIGKEEKIPVTREEVETAIKNLAETNLSEAQKNELETYIAFNIFQAKTLDLIKKTITSA